MTVLADLRALLDKTTLPWRMDTGERDSDSCFLWADRAFIAQADLNITPEFELAVAAVNSLPALLDVAEAAERCYDAPGSWTKEADTERAAAYSQLGEALVRLAGRGRSDG
jgi:hypothetical protein